VVSTGTARGLVIAIGAGTELGGISAMLGEMEPVKTPLQAKMDEIGKQLSIVALGIVAVIIGLGVLQGHPAMQMLTVGVSLAVAAIPEGLPIVVTGAPAATGCRSPLPPQ
jgi:Ca2+-transporting ATPase